MSTEALRKAEEYADGIFDGCDNGEWAMIKQALRDQETEIARLNERMLLLHGSHDLAVRRAERAESALATHRANYDALVIRLGEVTARLEAADGLLRFLRNRFDSRMDDSDRSAIDTHLKAADHGFIDWNASQRRESIDGEEGEAAHG